MKRKNLFILGMAGALVLAGAATLGGLWAGGVFDEPVEETEFVDSPKGDGEGMSLVDAEAGEATLVHKGLGVQVVENSNGTYDMRFVAALSDTAGLAGAKWVRGAIAGEDGTQAKAGAEFEIDTVYSGVTDFDKVNWDGDAPDTTVYDHFFVYTLKGIPEANKLSVIDVTLKLDRVGLSDMSVNEKANVQGLLGDGIVNAVVEAYGDEAGHYRAYTRGMSNYSSVTEVVIPERYYAIDGFVATDMGVIDRLENPGISTGAFESCSALVDLTLPDTINYMDTWCFSGCRSLDEILLPRDLTFVGSSAFSNLGADVDTLTVNYHATNLTSSSGTFSRNVSVVNVAADVKALATGLRSSYGTAYYAERVNYPGTRAEFAALPGATDGFWSDGYLYASDSVMRTVTFHHEGGTLEGYEGDTHTVNILDGYPIANPGRPTKDGYLFDSWVTDLGDAAEAAYDFDAPITGDLDIYAKFITSPDGVSFDKPLEVQNGHSYSVRTMVGMEKLYMKFTAPAADTYYFRAHDLTLDASAPNYSSTADDDNIYLAVYNDAEASVSLSRWDIKSNAAYARTNAEENFIQLRMEAGETKYVSFQAYYNSSHTERMDYGTATVDVFTLDNDDLANPTALTFGQNYPIVSPAHGPEYFYGFTLESAGDYVVGFNGYLGDYYISVYVYAVGSYGSTVVRAQGWSSTNSLAHLEAGSYVVMASVTDAANEDLGLSFYVRTAEAGESASTANAYTLGSEQTWTVPTDGRSSAMYWSFTAESTSTYIVTNNATSSSASVKVYDAEDTSTALVSVSGSSSGATGDVDVTSGKTYIVVTDFSYSPSDFTWKVEAAPAGYSFNLAIDLSAEAAAGSASLSTATGSISSSNVVSGGVYYKIDVPALENTSDSRFISIVADEAATATLALYRGPSSSDFVNKGSEVFANIGGEASTVYLWIGDTAASSVSLTISYPETIENGLSTETPLNANTLMTFTSAAGIAGGDLWTWSRSAEEPFAQQYVYLKFTVTEATTYYFYTLNYDSSERFDSKIRIYSDAGFSTQLAYNDDWTSSSASSVIAKPDTAHRYNSLVPYTVAFEDGQTEMTLYIQLQLGSGGYPSSYSSTYQAWSMNIEKAANSEPAA